MMMLENEKIDSLSHTVCFVYPWRFRPSARENVTACKIFLRKQYFSICYKIRSCFSCRNKIMVSFLEDRLGRSFYSWGLKALWLRWYIYPDPTDHSPEQSKLFKHMFLLPLHEDEACFLDAKCLFDVLPIRLLRRSGSSARKCMIILSSFLFPIFSQWSSFSYQGWGLLQ